MIGPRPYLILYAVVLKILKNFIGKKNTANAFDILLQNVFVALAEKY